MEGSSIHNYKIDLEAEEDLPATQIVEEDRVLKDVVAYVEVRSTNDNRSEAVEKELLLLGASVEKKFTSNVTHVVFKEGRNRTKTKAQKKGIHLVSVLWVENCKLNQEHVSERMYPAVVPRLKGTPLLMTKLKKAKSMQPRDFEEELASSAERVGRKRKKLEAICHLKSMDSTPSCSPRSTILVQDTQPRSPDDGFILTPIRLTIPDTPPSMREKMKKIREAREANAGAVGSYTTTEHDEDVEEKQFSLKQLQKNLFKHDEVEKVVLDASQSKDNSSHEREEENEKLTSSKKNNRKGSLPCGGMKKESKQRERNGRRSNCSLDDSTASLENENVVSENKNVDHEKVIPEATQATKGKKTMKKKLMSLTDLTEPHSVLIEPTKCSSVERPQLQPTKGKRGRKKKVTKADDSLDGVTVGTESTKGTMDTNSNNGSNIKDNKQKGRTLQTRQTRISDEEKAIDDKCAKNQKKRNTVSRYSDHCEAKKQKKALVNETHIENNDTEKTKQSPVAKIQDVTTQLNLTKDNGLVCSIRETTLSLSMSTAYTDSNMPSFLISQRKSIDEFNASQRHNKKRSTKDRTVLASINEKEKSRDMSSSDSDRSVTTGRRMGKVSNTQHRKIVRPSIVMTSLHSYEQDVVISVVKKLGGFVIAENVNETTTHVICGEPRRTLNVLHCLARGAWLLTKEWVIKSLEAGEWIPEAEFECTSSFPVCRTCRLEREKNPEIYHQSLFARIGPVYISGRSQPPRQHLAQLLKLCGGQVTGVKEKASVYFGSDYHPGMTCVKTNWLLDCITSQQLLPMDRYYLDRPKRDSSPAY